ncbi:hypothetical protein CVT24_007620 [Panaeolus cyanescens]|uniref:AB hydrolase-1 domain-containing protein n=1 Tax=Panaeolus cyanescens TaxID=181874 RepID=A0A409W546_9AGAR|nr:hypothetical protein CVT24_007620 [Panaeolus cyanescens]
MPPKPRASTLLGAVFCGIIVSLWYYGAELTVPDDLFKEAVVNGDISSASFDWSHVNPTKTLRWYGCYDGLECARLLVPMDHHNPSGKQGALALIRKASPLGSNHPDYRGPILFNPGGPGGSGIAFLSNNANHLAKILGPQFDLVSFDPRGVGASLPRASFYKSNFQRLIWGSGLHPINDNDVTKHWAKMKVINAMTRENDDGGLRFINTDQTARDMLSIVRAHGREKLQYWGFSYGTILGSTFAAMFPDKVERLIIDGVCDAYDYYDTLWSKNLLDTDKGIDVFVSQCHEAGPLAQLDHTVSSDIDLLQGVTFTSLYKPYAAFPLLAEAYAALAQGDGSIILSMAGGVDPLKCPAESNTEPVGDAQAAILCNDGAEVPGDLESTQKYAQMMKRLSPTWGPIWSGIRMNCIDWPKFPKTNFRGPFNATTSHPLLVIGNTADPVTPLWAAKKMSAGFTDSVVLTQDSPGHCSLAAPSVCTQSHIRRYFIDGTLPEPGTVCSPDTPIFSGQYASSGDGAQKSFSSLSEEEQDIYDAIQELSKKDALMALRPPIIVTMPPKSKAARATILTGVVLCGIVVSSWYYGVQSAIPDDLLKEAGATDNISRASFDWSHVNPTKNLRWFGCYDGLECARLLVPMDHQNPSGKQGALALIRKASPLGSDHPDYRGPILFNPGGPGGSGITFLSSNANHLAKILGPQFDLVSFDPRGVGASLPRASFYKSNFERSIWGAGLRPLHDDDVPKHWAKTKVINAMARENDDGDLRFINTDQTARDMLSIVHAHGREKLQYWGLSYGTVLGSTFAAMFPDKVERLIIDGVCDADDYYDTLWSTNLIDTDKSIDAFVSQCHEAGPVRCYFWAPTTSNIRNNITTLFDNVRRQPVAVASKTGPHGVIDIDFLQWATFIAIYTPYAFFPLLAEAYAALAQGDGSVILSMTGFVDPLQCPSESTTEVVLDATAAILCNDGADIPGDLESTQKYVQMMKNLSPTWGPIWAGIRLSCIDWPKFPKTNFRGPFNATTSHPLLVIGNTADPVTPLWAAKKMSAGFTDSVVLTQDSPGHCSLAAPSVCTQSHIRRYFIDGTLPEPGTVCSPDTPIFSGHYPSPGDGSQKSFSSLSAEEQDIYDAIQELSKKDSLMAFRPPIAKLDWHPCFNETQCARLSVPMDHHNPDAAQGAIALIRRVSPLGPDHPDYRGPIIFNPGGPGGSGIHFLSTASDLFAAIVGPQFDLVSFDPRGTPLFTILFTLYCDWMGAEVLAGVGASIPRTSFYKTNFERFILDTNTRIDAVTDENVALIWAKLKVRSSLARENDDGSLKYVNTDQTARDMLSILNAYGREKLQYWGFSFLGSTFAAMFPDKIERMVIDGVGDADDYYSTTWSTSLFDTDKVFDAFILGCHEAGSSGCAFWEPTVSKIRHKLTNLFNDVRQYPVSVASAGGIHGVVDVDLLRSTIFGALYSPYETFPYVAEALAALARGDGSLVLTYAGLATDPLECPADSPFEPVGDAQTAIMCNDGRGIPNDLMSTRNYVSTMKKLSPSWGPIWAFLRLTCINWPRFQTSNFRGPFNATTSHPLLVIGNTADPVTPLAGAKKMASGFTGSVVLTQDSAGHCSISAPSVCTQNYIRKYFVEGTLPKPGTVCPTDTPIFPIDNPVKAKTRLLSSLTPDEQVLYDAIQKLSKKRILHPPLFN